MDITIIITKLKEIMDDIFATKEEVPTKTSDLINDNNFATTANIPTKTSDLINDSNFLTEHQDLSQYVKKSELATQIDNSVIERYNSGLSTTQGLRGYMSTFYLFYDLYYGIKIDLEILYGGDSLYYEHLYTNFSGLTYDGEYGMSISDLTIKKPNNVNVEIYSMGNDQYGITITHTGTVPSSGTAKIMIYGLTPMYYY